MFEFRSPRERLSSAWILIGLSVLLYGLALHLAQGPGLELGLRWDAERAELSLGGSVIQSAPRPAGAAWRTLSLRFWHPPESLSGSRQSLRWQGARPLEGRWLQPRPERWSAPEGGSILLAEGLPPQGSLSLRVDEAEDLVLVLSDAALREGSAFLLRPAMDDQGRFAIHAGRGHGLEDYHPLQPLPALAGRRALAELCAWSAAALGLLALWALLAWALERAPRSPRWRLRGHAVLLAAFAMAVAAASLRWGGDGQPHVSDEIAACFQAKILAQERLAAPATPLPAAFRMDHILDDGRGWRGKYPLLWPMLLQPFQTLGYGWLAGPFFLGLGVLLLFAWARRSAGRPEALAAAGLLALSPQALWLGGSYFNHAASLAAALLLLWAVWMAVEERRREAWWLAGLGGAALAAMRPYSAALISAAAALWALAPAGRRRGVLKGLALLALLEGIAVGLSNLTQTGSPWHSPYLLYDPWDRPGFGPLLGSLAGWGTQGHDAWKGLANTALYLSDLRQRALGWPLSLGGGLLLLGLLFRRGWTRLDSLLWAVVLAVAGGHYFYWCGHLLTFGAFYWYEALPCLLWAGLRGGARAAAALRERGLPQARQALALLLALGGLWGLARVVPVQAAALSGYAGVDARLERCTEPLGPALRALVLVEAPGPNDYNAAFALQPPFLDGRFIYARARGAAEDRALAAYFPSRRVLRWDGKLLLPDAGAK